ncbi:LOW QUALITY PROTEIN: Transposase [Phytophthora palmivora]|uniref:Transposase n=1 Tax=Phytophthora palmivora TaxID=4796 RepID=A0A2P4YE55_9STRA|nr:LOW QUALITY PROTEIN: Transposase [Phytophthora palmivora]
MLMALFLTGERVFGFVGVLHTPELAGIITPSSAMGFQTPSTRTPPVLLQDVCLDKLVVFAPEMEPWMKSKQYRQVGTAYIVGRVCRRPMRGKFASLFEIRWLDSQFQNAVERVSVGIMQHGVENYAALTRLKDSPDWQELVSGGADDDINIDDSADLRVVEGYEEYDPGVLIPTSFEEVEAIENMRFEPTGSVDAPGDLYERNDGSTMTRLRPEYKHLFLQSTTSSFFAYLPLYFWHQVLFETNKYAIIYDIRITTSFTLHELMTFLGIMFYMALNDKGEYANYWGAPPEDMVFCGSSTSLDSIMSLNRYKLLRRCFSFNAASTTLGQDAAAPIRPILNLLKVTGGFYVDVGRNIALDEASVTCRSRQGRHMIVFNPMKPTGKYHFRLLLLDYLDRVELQAALQSMRPPCNFYKNCSSKVSMGEGQLNPTANIFHGTPSSTSPNVPVVIITKRSPETLV